MERLLTTEEVGELLRIDVVTVRRLVGRGELIAYRIAGEYRFSGKDVEEFVQSQRVEPHGGARKEAKEKDRFERFTERARRVMALAQKEATAYHHEAIGTEHLLLALLREGEGLAAKTLDARNITLKQIRDFVEELHPAGSYEASAHEQLPLTAHSKKTLELAYDEARDWNHSYLGTEHILLGLIREGEGIGAKILTQFQITIDDTRQDIESLLAQGKKSGFHLPTILTTRSQQPGKELNNKNS